MAESDEDGDQVDADDCDHDEDADDGNSNTNLLIILTQNLKSIGILPFGAGDLTKDNISGLIQSTFDLLRFHQKLTDAYGDLRNSYLRASKDLTCAQKCNARLKEVAEQREKTVRNLQENQSIAYREKTALNKKIKSAQDEIKHMICVAQSREAQHRNEGRKKEAEINKLKDRLDVHLNARGPGSTDVDLSRLKVKANVCRRKLATVQHSDMTCKEAVDAQKRTATQQQMWTVTARENEELRRILAVVHGQLNELVTSMQHEKVNFTNSACKTDANMNAFKLPFNKALGAQIEEDFRLKFVQLKKYSNYDHA